MKKPTNILKLATCLTITAAVALRLNAGTCTINGGADLQTIDGFGFSSAWCGQLSGAKNSALYGTLGMSLLRVRIDPNQNWSTEKANATAAHNSGAKVLGTPWSPPASMKSNGNVVHGSLKTSEYANYANYLKNAASSIGLDYVSVQNEPDWDPDYECCTWTSDQMLNFCKNNAQTIGKPVLIAEAVGFNDKYTDAVLNDSTAVNKITVAAGHFYGNGNYVHQNALNKGKRVWMTEHYIDNTQTSMPNCMVIAKEISDAMNNRFNAYFWWWVNDNSTINLVSSSGVINKNGYTIGQFAKWVRPGKVRCSATYNPSSNVYVTAYHNNGLVLVVVNTGTSWVNQTFAFQNISGLSSIKVHRTSSSENMSDRGSLSVANNTFTHSLPPQSVTTYHQY